MLKKQLIFAQSSPCFFTFIFKKMLESQEANSTVKTLSEGHQPFRLELFSTVPQQNIHQEKLNYRN